MRFLPCLSTFIRRINNSRYNWWSSSNVQLAMSGRGSPVEISAEGCGSPVAISAVRQKHRPTRQRRIRSADRAGRRDPAAGIIFIIKPARASDFHHSSFIFHHLSRCKTSRQSPNLLIQQPLPSYYHSFSSRSTKRVMYPTAAVRGYRRYRSISQRRCPRRPTARSAHRPGTWRKAYRRGLSTQRWKRS